MENSVMVLIKREILITSHEVLYKKSCMFYQFLFCKKKTPSKIWIFLA